MSGHFRFCPACGAALGEARGCACGWRRRPTVGAAVVLIESGRILLGRRFDGGWCVPCGRVEWNESIEDAARREFKEETGLDVELRGVLAVLSNFHDPADHSVGVWYEGVRTGGTLAPGDDLVEAAWHPLDRLPPLRFPTDAEAIGRLGP
jgi:ADP-ribose pyrophosphatase YjhB (NUDIX family)